MALVFIAIPLLGVCWYVNLIITLKRLKHNQDIHNYTIIGGLLTFAFICAGMLGIASLH